jgi:hypothetical protein
MLRPYLLVIALALVACTSVRTFEMTWEVHNEPGACQGAGVDPRYASEQRVTLRYRQVPNYFTVICSNRLANALKANGKPVVPMVERRNGGPGSSTSICAIAGLTADAPGT